MDTLFFLCYFFGNTGKVLFQMLLGVNEAEIY